VLACSVHTRACDATACHNVLNTACSGFDVLLGGRTGAGAQGVQGAGTFSNVTMGKRAQHIPPHYCIPYSN